jgi:hypothetical protein
MDILFRLRSILYHLHDLRRFPRCVVIGHRLSEPFCGEVCHSIFCAGSWSGFELSERIRKLTARREKPPF